MKKFYATLDVYRATIIYLYTGILPDLYNQNGLVSFNFPFDEKVFEADVRCRTIGDITCTGVTLSKAKSLEEEGKKIIHMEVGEPDFLPPKIVKDSLEEVFDKGFLKYGQAKGMPVFREALAKFVSKKFVIVMRIFNFFDSIITFNLRQAC